MQQDPLARASVPRRQTPEQSSVAIGSYLSYAQARLPAADYDKIAAAIPGATDNIAAAKEAGAVTGPTSDPMGLSLALSKVGISPEQASQVIPVLNDHVGGSPDRR